MKGAILGLIAALTLYNMNGQFIFLMLFFTLPLIFFSYQAGIQRGRGELIKEIGEVIDESNRTALEINTVLESIRPLIREN